MRYDYEVLAGPVAGVLRAATRLLAETAPVEDADDPGQLRDYLRSAWDCPDTREALRLASPHLAAEVDKLTSAADPAPSRRALARAAASVRGYLLRAGSRATPFGLFAGVTTVSCGPATAQFRTRHVALARPSAAWLVSLTRRIERGPLWRVLPVTVNTSAFLRGSRLVFRTSRSGARPSKSACGAPLLCRPSWHTHGSRSSCTTSAASSARTSPAEPASRSTHSCAASSHEASS